MGFCGGEAPQCCKVPAGPQAGAKYCAVTGQRDCSSSLLETAMNSTEANKQAELATTAREALQGDFCGFGVKGTTMGFCGGEAPQCCKVPLGPQAGAKYCAVNGQRDCSSSLLETAMNSTEANKQAELATVAREALQGDFCGFGVQGTTTGFCGGEAPQCCKVPLGPQAGAKYCAVNG